MKSTKMIEFRTTIPAPAIKPIIEVAVKNAPSAPCAGKILTSENGMADGLLVSPPVFAAAGILYNV